MTVAASRLTAAVDHFDLVIGSFSQVARTVAAKCLRGENVRCVARVGKSRADQRTNERDDQAFFSPVVPRLRAG
jgi:hypothetical protein